MKVIQAFILSIVHSFFAEIFMTAFNIFRTQDIIAALSTTSYVLFINTLWSFMFLLVLGGGRRMSIKIFISPFFSSIFTAFTIFLIGEQTDWLVLYMILMIAGIFAVSLLYSYRRSYE